MNLLDKKFLAGSSLICLSAAVMPMNGAVAQTDIEEDTAVLATVVVSAQKREQTNTEVPISISVVDGQTLTDSGLNTVIDLPQSVPGLRIDLAGAFAQPTIRGVGSAIAAAGFNSNIATYIDGFYAPSQLTTDTKLLSLANVQVVKGPQGTLFGRNATGGAILLTSRDPSAGPALELNASYASFNRFDTGVYGAQQLSDTLSVDIAAFYETGDGFLDNIATGTDDDGEFTNWGLRVSALYEPNDRTSFKLAYTHSDRDDPTPVATSNFNNLSAGAAINSLFPAPPYAVASARDEVSNDTETSFTSKTDGLFLTADFDLGWADLKSLTMYRDEESRSILDLDGAGDVSGGAFLPLVGGPLFAVEFPIENQTFSQEFNLSGTVSENLDWLVGLFYLQFDEDYTQFDALAPGFGLLAPTTLYNVGVTNDSYAAFADATWEFKDNWFLTGGLRYNVDETDAFFNLTPVGGLLLGGLPAGRTDASESFDDVTYRAILRHEPTDRSSIYLSYSTGYKAGALTPSAFTTTSLEPEDITALELGYKWTGDRTRFEAAIFNYSYENIQLAQYNGLQALVTNAAEATVNGAELQLSTFLTDEFSVDVGLSYLDGEYDSFPTAQSFVQDLNPLSPTFSTFQNPVVGATGNDIQRSPDLTGNIAANYETDLANGVLRLSGNYYYTSSFFFDPVNQFEQDGYGLLNLRAAWTDPSDRWTLAVFGKNVTDEEYLTQVLPGAVAIQQTFGEPATGGVSVSVKF